MSDPLKSIEDRKAWMDFGKQAALIYQGAMAEGATETEALSLVTAFYAGMFRGSRDEETKSE